MFADELERWGDSPALIAEDGTAVSYAELAVRADAFAARLGDRRAVLYLEARNTVEAVAAYVGALRARHPVLWAIHSQPGLETRLCEAFGPENLYHFNGSAWILETGPAGPEPHPDLAVLLSTSGSTGSPKLVRLSRDAVQANAVQIAEYLGIAPGQRAVTSLPLGYSYGLSVLNSHLAAGAAVILTDRSVTDPGFWKLFRDREATSIAGVPYTYELFERIGLRDDPPASLKTMTQAGGRLAPELVAAYARWSQAHGIRFFPMYGQTEATARMAYLPPELAEAYSDCIGQAIPRGEFRIIDEHGQTVDAPETPGELVYRGPNVMMGYGLTREDLAKGPELSELRTGDIAVRVDERFYRIVGRASRFSKIAGKRIGLDDVEALLKARGVAATVAGDDRRLAVWIAERPDSTEEIQDFVAARCGVPRSLVAIVGGGDSPRLASGKPDYRAIVREAERAAAAAEADPARQRGSPIASAYATALGRPGVDASESFISLGGDSLAYVQASIEVERQLGFLPDGWEQMTIGELELMAEPGRPGRKGWLEKLSTDVVIRTVAILAVVLGHLPAVVDAGLPVKGGALVLFMLAGYSLARFQRGALLAGRPHEIVVNFFLRVIVPYYLLVLLVTPLSKDAQLTLPTLLLVSNLVGENRGPLMPYWFPEAMIQCLILFGALFLIPAVRRFVQARPFVSGMTFLGGAMAAKALVPLVWKAPLIAEWPRSPDAWGYGLMIGWAACFAKTTPQRLALLAAVTAFAAWDWGPTTSRFAFIELGLAALLFVPRVTLPKPLGAGVVAVAAASFYIYLAHMLVIQVLDIELGFHNTLVILGAAIGAGLVGHRLWQFVLPRLTGVAQRLRPRGAMTRKPAPGQGAAL